MKKFLLLIIVFINCSTHFSCFAENKFYIDSFLPQFEVGDTVKITVKASFDTPVSTYLCHLSLPEGLEQVYPEALIADRFSLFDPKYYYGTDFINIKGAPQSMIDRWNLFYNTPYSDILFLPGFGIPLYLGASYVFLNCEDTDSFLYAYWDVGEYDDMMYIYLKATDTFKGGQIRITTQSVLNAFADHPASPSSYEIINLETYPFGDCARTYHIDMDDMTMLISYLLHPDYFAHLDPDYYVLEQADFNGNGVIDIADAAALWDAIYLCTWGDFTYLFDYQVSHGECIVNVYPATGIIGDLNNDKEINLADVNILIDSILTEYFQSSYDINNDGEINIADVCELINIILANQ